MNLVAFGIVMFVAGPWFVLLAFDCSTASLSWLGCFIGYAVSRRITKNDPPEDVNCSLLDVSVIGHYLRAFALLWGFDCLRTAFSKRLLMTLWLSYCMIDCLC